MEGTEKKQEKEDSYEKDGTGKQDILLNGEHLQNGRKFVIQIRKTGKVVKASSN